MKSNKSDTRDREYNLQKKDISIIPHGLKENKIIGQNKNDKGEQNNITEKNLIDELKELKKAITDKKYEKNIYRNKNNEEEKEEIYENVNSFNSSPKKRDILKRNQFNIEENKEYNKEKGKDEISGKEEENVRILMYKKDIPYNINNIGTPIKNNSINNNNNDKNKDLESLKNKFMCKKYNKSLSNKYRNSSRQNKIILNNKNEPKSENNNEVNRKEEIGEENKEKKLIEINKQKLINKNGTSLNNDINNELLNILENKSINNKQKNNKIKNMNAADESISNSRNKKKEVFELENKKVEKEEKENNDLNKYNKELKELNEKEKIEKKKIQDEKENLSNNLIKSKNINVIYSKNNIKEDVNEYNSEDVAVPPGQKRHKILNLKGNTVDKNYINVNSIENSNNNSAKKNNNNNNINKNKKFSKSENLSKTNNNSRQRNLSTSNLGNNRYIYSPKNSLNNNIYANSKKDNNKIFERMDEDNNNPINSFKLLNENKRNIHANRNNTNNNTSIRQIENIEERQKVDNNKMEKNIFYAYNDENISYSQNEDIESSESSSILDEEEEEEEEEIEVEEIEDDMDSEQNEIEKEVYLLELEDNGLPNLQNDEIVSCNINSLINLSIYNGLSISKDVSLITNCENEFPSPFYLEEIIHETNVKNNKVLNMASPKKKSQRHIVNLHENNSIPKSLKKYQIFPTKINTKIYFRILCKRAGNISFVFMYREPALNNKFRFTKPFHILVNPLIDLSNKMSINLNRNKVLEVNQIQMQSIIPKNIGNISSDFEKYYEEASLLEYNFIHFHSLQELSKDENIYVIKEQNELNDKLFLNNSNNKNNEDNNVQTNQKYQLLLNSIKNLKNKYHIGAVTDVILSQTSSESNWIYSNKDCTYNLKNTPWLNVSYELDKILLNYSKLFAEKKVSCNSAPYIYNSNDINQIILEITNYVRNGNLYEFFMISEDKYLSYFKTFYKNLKSEEGNKNYIAKRSILLNEITKAFEGDREDKLNLILTDINYMYNLLLQSCTDYGYERLGVKMCIEYVGILIIESYREKNTSKKFPSEYNFLKDIKNYIKLLNHKWIKEINELLKISIFNIKEYLKYKYLQLNYNKKINQLIESYFVVKNQDDPSQIYLSNGWIMDSEDPNYLFPNTVKYGSWYHLKRKVIIFKDTIKINYGASIDNTSIILLNHMKKYISNLSSIFDGLFIESITQLPIHILKYLIYIARRVNPSIIILCNISNGYQNLKDKNNYITNLKKKYVEELGINLFIDELVWNNNINEFINTIINNGSSCNSNIYTEIITHFNKNLYSSSFIDENKIIFGKFRYLKPKKPFNIIYDIYNNQTYFEKFNKLSINIAILSLMGLLDTSIGSVYGFDQLYPLLPNIENEYRKYYIDNSEIKNLIKKSINSKVSTEETFEVFFEYHPEETPQNNFNYIYSVHLALNIFDYNPNIQLTKIKNNLYMTKTRLPPGKYYYQYVINENIWTYDNSQPIEADENGIKYNVIDLRSQNKIIIPDIKLFRKEINKIRNNLKHKQSEIYIQKNQDMYGIIRIVTDPNSLINNNIDENKLQNCKKISSSENEDCSDDDYELNNKIYKVKDLKKTIDSSKSRNDNLAKSFDNFNNLENSLTFNEKKNLVNSINVDINRRNINLNENKAKEKKLLEASMDVNLNSSFNNNLKQNENTNNTSTDIEIYDGYAIICFPSFNNRSKCGKGEITLPGKLSEPICACYFNNEKIDLSPILMDKKLVGARNEIYFTKDINYLKCIANIKYSNNKTTIDFYNAPPNLGLIIRFVNEGKNNIKKLDENLEILFNKGNEFINYFDIFDINKLLFKTESEERVITYSKRGTYELKINLFNDLNKINESNNRYLKDKKLKFIYAGMNQLIELIKIIKRTENQNLFYNKLIKVYEEPKHNSVYSLIEKKFFIQSLYKDIISSDNYISYIMERLSEIKSFKLMYDLIKKEILPQYKLLPPFIKPAYFEKLIISIYQNIIRVSLGKIPSYILNFGDFAIGLSLSRYEFIKKYLGNSSFDNKLIKRYDIKKKKSIFQNLLGLNISNGLPLNDKIKKIFTRDILISFNSLFLIPKLFYEAKIILKLIGSYMKYGLIPDKIDHSNNIKYYSRDICWLYIKAIKDYIYVTLDYKFLREEIYLVNQVENVKYSYLKQKNKKFKRLFTIENIIQLIFQYHAQGISFEDKKIEPQPYQRRPQFNKKIENSDINGLKINIYLDTETGFIYGGNTLNAGTWMNHIGSSAKGKNLNIPSTPRNGADIEIIALLYNCLNFVIEINYKNYYSYKNVILNNNEKFSFYQWSLLIKKFFEKKFFVKKIYSVIQNKPNIYKDYIIKPNNPNISFSNENNEDDEETEEGLNMKDIKEEDKNEFKLRPNILLAIFYAPDLFSYENIQKVMENIEKYLLRPEIKNINKQNNISGMNGVKTLDKTDVDYNGKLDFRETSYYKTSGGFNIHNGVEFVWLYGIYLMIKIKYCFNFNYNNIENDSNDSFIPEQTDEMIRYISKKLIPYIKYMKENKFMGVPEIIDEIGNVSNEGNQSDLKSMATLFELIDKLAWVCDKINNGNEDEITSKEEND